MTPALALKDEFRGINERTWRSVVASVLLHALLIGLLALLHHVRPLPPVITEISWLEPEELVPAPPSLPERVEPVEPAAPQARQFERRLVAAELEPQPQVPAINDRLQSRLATTPLPERPAILSAGLAPSAALWQPAVPAAGPRAGVGTGAPVAMRRETAGAAPLALRRDAPAPSARLQAEAAAAPAPSLPERAEAAPAARSLPGLSLTGPAAARPVREHPLPVYPEWAKREAVEASVSLHFVVREDGRLKDSILVEKTSGYADFDNSALTALRGWRFAPLPTGVTGDQWGTITFNFRLRDDR